jgi:hypothetical protein
MEVKPGYFTLFMVGRKIDFDTDINVNNDILVGFPVDLTKLKLGARNGCRGLRKM